MTLQLPGQKRIAVALTVDFDAHSVWYGTFDRTTPGYLSRGDFGAHVGIPRLLNLFEKHHIKTTFCVPSHTLLTFPAQATDIVRSGHEIAAHGCYHEQVTRLTPAREHELMRRQIEQYHSVLGTRPRGYRSPSWDFSDATMALLDEFEFEWDSSLMGREFEPYHPLPVHVDWEEHGSSFGQPARFLEIPVSWYLDDFPFMEYIGGVNAGLGDHDVLFRRWRDIFDYALEADEGSVYVLTIHPQCSGHSFLIAMLERLIRHMEDSGAAHFCSLSEVYDSWTDEPVLS